MTERLIQQHPRFQVALSAKLELPGCVDPLLGSTFDLSLGGVFVRTEALFATNTVVQLSLRPEDALVDTWARVVHTIDAERGRALGRPVGMGLEFAPLRPENRAELLRLLRDHAREAAAATAPLVTQVDCRDRAACRGAPRFVGGSLVHIRTEEQEELRELWMQDISHGGLFVATESPPPTGARLEVLISTPRGEIRLRAEVVHAVAPEVAHQTGVTAGAGLRFADLDADRRRALESFIGDRPPTVLLPQPQVTASGGLRFQSLKPILGRLFDGLERGDLLGALGLPPHTTSAGLQRQLTELKSLLRARPGDASPPQLARLDTALRAVSRLENRFRQRESPPPSAQDHGVPAAPPQSVAPTNSGVDSAPGAAIDPARLKTLIERARAHESDGHHFRAWEAFRSALQISGGGTGLAGALQKDIARVGVRVQLERLDGLLDETERLTRRGRVEQAERKARAAAQLLDALAVDALGAGAASAGSEATTPGGVVANVATTLRRLQARNDARSGVPLARWVVAQDDGHVDAWRYLHRAYLEAGHERLAAAAGEQLRQLGHEDRATGPRLQQLRSWLRR